MAIKPEEIGMYGGICCCGSVCLGGFIGLIVLLCSITSLGPAEQVVVSGPEGKYVINGPQTTVVSPSRKKEHRKVKTLTGMEYAIVKNTRSGEIRHEEGEQQLWLGAYDEVVSVKGKVTLQKQEYIRLIDTLTGTERVVQGDAKIVPNPLEESPNGTEKAIKLGTHLAVLTLNKTSGRKRLISTGGSFVPAPYEIILEVRTATLLSPREYAVVQDLMSGTIRHEVGPKLFQPLAYDDVLKVKTKIILEKDQYIRLMNEKDGTERIVRGPQTFMPDPAEVYPEGVEKAKFLDTDTAVLVLNELTGQEKLISETGVYFPTENEEILEERKLIRVSPNEVVVVRDDKGVLTIYEGSYTAASAFFLPAYSQVVEQTWSSYAKLPPPGQPQVPTKVKLTKVNMLQRTMVFSYEVRTSDNVRMSLEGTIFWRVRNVGLMINTTNDPEGDIWHHSRSALIQGVSKSSLQTFMADFNNITMQAFNEQAHDGFYDKRGVELIQMELTKYECADESVSTILQQIIQESTNKINRKQAQASANEVAAASLAAEIQLEKQKTELIKTQAANKRLEAQMQGEAAGMSLMRAADSFIGGLNDTVPNVTSRMELYRLHETLNSKNTDTQNLAHGKAQLYLTPSNVNLKIVEGAPGVSPAMAEAMTDSERRLAEGGPQEL